MHSYRAEEYLQNAARLRRMADSVSNDVNRAELFALAIKWEDLARYADRYFCAASPSNSPGN